MARHPIAAPSLALAALMAILVVPVLRGGTKAADKPGPTPEEQREARVIQRFLTVLEKNPRRGTAVDRIYGYHIERGSLEPLIRTYRHRADKEPTDGIASLIVGLLEAQRGKDTEAVAAFRQAKKRLPDNALASYYLGQSLVMVGQPDAAAKLVSNADEAESVLQAQL